jgi:type II secretory pathway pseudopilin PulG
VVVVLVGALVLLVVLGILAAIAIPVYLSQREKAADASTKADASTLGKEIATWYVDHAGGPPAVTVSGGEYSVDHVAVGAASSNVQLGGITGTGPTDWCVWVTNPEGDFKDFQYSADGGLQPGTC